MERRGEKRSRGGGVEEGGVWRGGGAKAGRNDQSVLMAGKEM